VYFLGSRVSSRIFVLLLIIFFLIISVFYPSVVRADNSTAQNTIASVRKEIIDCFEAAKAAEAAGANISALTSTLDSASSLVSKAELAYSSGNFSEADSLVARVQASIINFVSTANSLQNEAIQKQKLDFLFNFVGSITVTVIVILSGVVTWVFFKRKYFSKGNRLNLVQFKAFFIVIIAVLALLVVSPALQRILVYPQTEFFSEVWLLSSAHNAGGFPSNITANENYQVFLGGANHLGTCAYYVVEVKFRNQTQSAPDNFDKVPSNLPSLYNITMIVADKESWEQPGIFSLNYSFINVTETVYHNVTVSSDLTGHSTIEIRAENVTALQAVYSGVTFNGVYLDLKGLTSDWDGQKSVFYGNLIFELWMYNEASNNFQYHERYVDLKLNMTTTGVS
jgi:hypothetical protein